MSKKNIFIIVIVLIIFLLIGVGVLVSLQKQTNNTTQPTPENPFSFWPFGNNAAPETRPIENTDTQNPNPELALFNPKAIVRQLSKDQVAGAGFIERKEGTVVRFIEKINGHTYDIELFSPTETPISKETLGAVYKGVWTASGNGVLIQQLEDNNEIINTQGISIKASTTPEALATVSTVEFPTQIKQIYTSGENFLYAIENQNSTMLYTNDVFNKKSKQVWSSPIKELSFQYINAKTAVAYTKPAQFIKGYAYTINLDTGRSTKIIGDIPGLSLSVSPNGENSIFISQNENISMFFKSKATTSPLYPETLPEKCVWSRKDQNIAYCAVPKTNLTGQSMTSWYLGVEMFSDSLWKYNLKNNISIKLVDLKTETGQDIDVIEPLLSQKEDYLIFINKRDKILWSVSLVNAENPEETGVSSDN